MKFLFRILEWIAPQYVATKAYNLISNPRSHKLRDFEESALKEAQKGSKTFRQFDIATYKWGFGPKEALLIHGWEGRAGNFAAIVPYLVDQGYTVYAFDAPSHGASTRAFTSLFDYSDLVSEYLGERRFDLLVSHSFGSVPLTLSLAKARDYPVNRLLMITSPNKFTDRVDQIADQIGVTDKTVKRVTERFENETGHRAEELSVVKFCEKIVPFKGMVVHGSEDAAILHGWSKAVAETLPNTEFRELEGLGHYRILWSEKLQLAIQDLIGQ